MAEYKESEVIIQELLEDFGEQRKALNQMVTDVEELKKNINSLFPEKLNARFAKLFEEKVKTAVSMLNVLLDVRKELIKLTKDEIDIRRKVVGKGDLNDMVDVRSLVKKVEQFNDTKDKLDKKKKKIKKPKEILLEET